MRCFHDCHTFPSSSLACLDPIIPLPVSSFGQSDPALNLKGAIDFHVHQGPDSVDRAIDADDLARLPKRWHARHGDEEPLEDTAALVYMVRKEVPGIELFGGITQDLAVGGINLEAVKHMAAMKGGWAESFGCPRSMPKTP